MNDPLADHGNNADHPDRNNENNDEISSDLPDSNKLFSQSRALNALNWLAFYKDYALNQVIGDTPLIDNDANNQTTVTMLDFDPKTEFNCTPEYNEDATIAFNRAHFHRQIYDMMSRNPLSTLYSLAWSLCLHIEGRPNGDDNNNTMVFDWLNDRSVPYPDDAEYIRVWFPLILLHRMTKQLMRLLANFSVNRDDGSTSRLHDENTLFTFDDIRASDERFRESFRSVIQNNSGNDPQQGSASPEDIEARRARYRADKEAYLSSPLFDHQCRRTPYGLSEIDQTNDHNNGDNQYRMRFIPRLKNLADKQKLVYNFKRYQAYEPMRERIEQKLRALFPGYHAKYGVYVDSWLFGSVCINEAMTEPEANTRSYVMYWQLQKSALLWILVHTLFALNAMLSDLMLEDLLWFVAHDLDRFIECGLCHSHWTDTNGSQFEWRQHEENFSRQRRSRSDATETVQNKSVTVNTTILFDSFDLAMFYTHNNIQIQRVNQSRGLTNAALNALRRDYAYFAGAFMGCLVEDSGDAATKMSSAAHNRHQDSTHGAAFFRCGVYDLEGVRGDVCATPKHLYLTTMLRDANQIMKMAQNDSTMLACTLSLERKHIDERFAKHLA